MSKIEEQKALPRRRPFRALEPDEMPYGGDLTKPFDGPPLPATVQPRRRKAKKAKGKR